MAKKQKAVVAKVTAKKTTFQKSIEELRNNVKDQLTKLGVPDDESSSMVARFNSICNPTRKKTLEDIDTDELDALETPDAWKKLSNKEKGIYFLRCGTSPWYRDAEPNKRDSVMVKQLWNYMHMILDTDTVCVGDSIQYCTLPDLGKGLKADIEEHARKLILSGFFDTCHTMGIVTDPSDEFRAYPVYLQKWLLKQNALYLKNRSK